MLRFVANRRLFERKKLNERKILLSCKGKIENHVSSLKRFVNDFKEVCRKHKVISCTELTSRKFVTESRKNKQYKRTIRHTKENILK